MSHLTDTEKTLRPIRIQQTYRFWLDFRLDLKHRSPVFRRWFVSIEERNQFVVDLPRNYTVTNHGEEPEP